MTVRNVLFQVHWFLGITAGIVIAFVGLTGAILSFEQQILKSLNPGVMTVTHEGEAPLAPEALIKRVSEQQPKAHVQSLSLSADRTEAARVGFAPHKDAKPGPGGRTRGETRYVNPYTGQLLAKPKGEGFFRTTMRLHRWLAIDEVGKQIVAFSTLALIYFCLSGIYLRWPRRWGSLRTWLALDWKQKGRNFLWHLHSIVGTWVLLAYLVMSLSGLWWSYGWYKDALSAWADLPTAQPRGESARGAKPSPQARGQGATPAADTFDVQAAWTAFENAVPAWSSATLQWPRGDGPVQVRYLDRDPRHERANNTLELDPANWSEIKHERYADKSWKQRLVGGIFAVHRGSYFGLAGVIIFMLASLLMPLFAITGWMLYLQRRKTKRANQRLSHTLQPDMPGTGATVLVAYASQTGTAERLAWMTAQSLVQAGVAVEVAPVSKLEVAALQRYTRTFWIVSTFGEGQGPDAARAFAKRLAAAGTQALSGVHVAVLALGDRQYGQDFCRFGAQLERDLRHAGAEALFDRVEVDALDEAALRHWQALVGQATGTAPTMDWSAPRYGAWTLTRRELLNPNSAGAPAFALSLVSPELAPAAWQAGDIAEIGPQHAPARVQAFLSACGLSGQERVSFEGVDGTLADALARSILPTPQPASQRSPQQMADALTPLPHREYSIASVPAQGSLDLLVRRQHAPDGTVGLGSGWLCEHAHVGQAIALRVRTNTNFHSPAPEVPMILIGNGTGMAGLRAHLLAREGFAQARHWLVFGERNALHDDFFGADIQRWQASGLLERVTRAWSRDGQGPRYVQDALGADAERVRSWIAEGASVYVCGSLEGMAPGVDAALQQILGASAVEALAAAGRYRRDVY